MNNKNTIYTLSEGHFLTTHPEVENTLNILVYRDTELNEYNIVINRATLGEDETVEQFCEKEVGKFANEMPGFKEEGKMLSHDLGNLKLPVVQIANSYLRNGERFHQVQSIVKLPKNKLSNPNDDRLIIFTLSSFKEFTEYQRKHYVRVLNSFSPNTGDVTFDKK
nr:DcrB-related protein [uncultured Moellerella sp.]